MKKTEIKKKLAEADQARSEMDRPLTKRQREILDFVIAHKEKFGFPPTRAEIGVAFDLWETWIQQHLSLIARKGYIKLSRAARAIELLDRSSR